MSVSIDHIVYLMLENRGFDHLLGWLYEPDEKYHVIPEPKIGFNPPPYNGLYTGNYFNLNNAGERIYVSKITRSEGQKIPNVDPNEPFQHVQVQIADNMQGFIRDFSSNTDNPEQIMQCYTPDSLPMINYLAKRYAVSDVYFSSIPTQTNCNRAFSLTGNSIGYYHYFGDKKVAMVNNYWTYFDGGPGKPYEFTEKTVFNVLSEHGHDNPDKDWTVFYSQTWPGLWFDEGDYCFTQDLLCPSLKNKTDHFKDIDQFFTLAATGGLPKFSYLEPTWYEEKWDIGHTGTDYHPPSNVGTGEAFLKKIYTALRNSPNWENTLFIINFDEHGGTYDHVEPPSTVAPWHNPADGTTKPELSPKHPFNFEKLGVRVPLILVSPLIQPHTVFRPGGEGVFDHTSVIATILNYFEIPKENWQLGSRTANALTLENVISDIHVIVDDEIDVELLPTEPSASAADMEVNDLQRMIGHRFLWRKMQEKSCSPEVFDQLIEQHFADISTMSQLNKAIKTVLDSMNKKE